MSARNRELLALIPVALLLVAGFTAVFLTESPADEIGDLSLIYGGYFLALCFAAHLFLRFRLPNADPYLLPLCALLAAIGLVVIYRIKDELAFDQASVFVLGLVVFCLTITFLRDYHVLERYRYLIAVAGILLLLGPFITRNQTNGAYLSVDLGPLSFQPSELAKLCIVVFLASYLAEKREMLSVAARRVAGLTIPPLKHFGPLLAVWGAAMLMLVFIRDLGSSLMFFGAFLALLYVATSRFSYVLVGLALFAFGAFVLGNNISHVQDRVEIWLDPFGSDAIGAGQVQQSLFAQADGGLFGQGLGESLLKLPGPFAPDCQVPYPECGSILPAPHTDFIFAVITMELGLFGACAVIAIYALIAARGFKTAVMAPDGFSKLLAAGLTAIFALQAFVIIGGVTKVIPLTGVTLPFVSFGGSSIVANMILLALLLLVSDRARRPSPATGPRSPREQADRPHLRARPVAVHDARLLHLEVGRVRRRGARGQDPEPPAADHRAADPTRLDHHLRRRPGRREPAGGRRRGTRSTCATTRRVPCSAIRSATASSTLGRSGIELSENDLLIGEENEFASIIDQIRGRQPEGADLALTIDAEAQRIATEGLQGAITDPESPGAALVAIEPVDRRRAGDGLGPRLRSERGPGPGDVRAASNTTRSARRWSTDRPRASTRRARR